MPKIKEFKNPKLEKIHREIDLYSRDADQAHDELDSFLAKLDLKANNGLEMTDADSITLWQLMANVSRASGRFREALKKLPTYDAQKMDEIDVDIFEEARKIYKRKTIPLFVPDEELDDFLQNHPE